MSRAAILASERIAQIGAITRVLLQKCIEQLNDNPSTADGHESVVEAINDILVDEGLTTRSELQRFTAVERARTDQELADRRGPNETAR